jgi:MFS family permease
MYWIASFIEGVGMAQIYAFLPNRLTEIGVAAPDVGPMVGLLGSLFFVTGLPVVPLWGVWADKYSRKAVIVRSALVEAVVFGIIAASVAPWQLVVGMLLVGFQLGNSGVMIAAIRDATPHRRLGLALGIFAASSPLGFGAGPALGAFMIDDLHLTSASVFALAAALSIGVAVLLTVASREVRPRVVPAGSTLRLAFGAVRGVMSDPVVRWLFVVYGLVFLGRQMSAQYMALLVHDVEGTSLDVAGSVGLVLGVAAIAGAALRPPAVGPDRRLAGRGIQPGERLPGSRGRDGVGSGGHGDAGRASLRDPEPDLPAALLRRHRRSGPRGGHRERRPAGGLLRGRGRARRGHDPGPPLRPAHGPAGCPDRRDEGPTDTRGPVDCRPGPRCVPASPSGRRPRGSR